MKDYLFKVKVLNNHLQKAMDKRGITSAADLSRQSGVSYTNIRNFLNLKQAPYNKNLEPRESVVKLSEYLNIMICDLFPEDQLYEALENNSSEIEVDKEELKLLNSTISEPDNLLVSGELNGRLNDVLDTLTPREKLVIQLRFGLGGNGKHTFREVGEIINVCYQRVREIETKSLRKLRHPSRTDFILDKTKVKSQEKEDLEPFKW